MEGKRSEMAGATNDVGTRLARLEEQFHASEKATRLQATEYERRLAVLNHEHERVRGIQVTSVTQERFDEYTKTEKEKTEVALERVNEKFDDYVKRFEARQREVENAIEIQKAAAEHARRQIEEQQRKTNRNIAALGVLLTAVVVIISLVTGAPV